MSRNHWTIICVAYIIGLLSTSFYYFSDYSLQDLAIVAMGLTGLSIASSILIVRFPYARKYRKFCLGATLIAIFALVYFQLRIPQPKAYDVSHLLTKTSSQFIAVEGKVLTEPRLTESERIKFWFKPNQVQKPSRQDVSGKLYVTLPLSPELNRISWKTLKH